MLDRVGEFMRETCINCFRTSIGSLLFLALICDMLPG